MEMAKTEKVDNWDSLIALMKEREKHFKGKREKTDHDFILYGASRDGTTLEEYEKSRKRKK